MKHFLQGLFIAIVVISVLVDGYAVIDELQNHRVSPLDSRVRVTEVSANRGSR